MNEVIDFLYVPLMYLLRSSIQEMVLIPYSKIIELCI